MAENCPEWCLVDDHTSDGEEPIHVAFRESVTADDGEVLVEVSAGDEDFGDLSVDILGEASFSDEDAIGDLLLSISEAQSILGRIRTAAR